MQILSQQSCAIIRRYYVVRTRNSLKWKIRYLVLPIVSFILPYGYRKTEGDYLTALVLSIYLALAMEFFDFMENLNRNKSSKMKELMLLMGLTRKNYIISISLAFAIYFVTIMICFMLSSKSNTIQRIHQLNLLLDYTSISCSKLRFFI